MKVNSFIFSWNKIRSFSYLCFVTSKLKWIKHFIYQVTFLLKILNFCPFAWNVYILFWFNMLVFSCLLSTSIRSYKFEWNNFHFYFKLLVNFNIVQVVQLVSIQSWNSHFYGYNFFSLNYLVGGCLHKKMRAKCPIIAHTRMNEPMEACTNEN